MDVILTINRFLFLGDELLADSFPMQLVDDVVYEVQTKVSCELIVSSFFSLIIFFQMQQKTEGSYDIGANPSEEEQEESLESGAVTVNNLVDAMRLVVIIILNFISIKSFVVFSVCNGCSHHYLI